MALFGWFPFVAIAISSVSSGWLSDRLIARGYSPTRVRKSFAGIGLTFATILVPVVLVQDPNTAMALLTLACLSFGIYTSNLFAITQTLAGPRAAGKWTSFQNGFGNLAGVLAPVLTGLVVDQHRRVLSGVRAGGGIRPGGRGDVRARRGPDRARELPAAPSDPLFRPATRRAGRFLRQGS